MAQPENNALALKDALEQASAVLVGAGAGLSTSAGLTYTGERFERLFSDFIAKYGIRDMYSGGFFPFPTPEERWAWWSRHIWCNRYEPAPKDTYTKLLRLLANKNYFVITTNVDHQFQLAGFSKERLFYTQGDYGLWQCSIPCHNKTYDNLEPVKQMLEQQSDMRIPTGLVPHCPVCGEPIAMNLRADNSFVQDDGWYAAAERYSAFLDENKTGSMLYLELGVGANTPGIIKYPFWRFTAENPQAHYACINYGETYTHQSILGRSILIDGDIDAVLNTLLGDEG